MSHKQFSNLCWNLRLYWCTNIVLLLEKKVWLSSWNGHQRHCFFFVITFYNTPTLSPSCRQLDAVTPCFPLHPQHRRDDERGRTKEQLSFSLRLHPAAVRAHMWRQIIAVSKSAVAWYCPNTWTLVCVCQGCVTQNEIVSSFIPL